MGKCCAASTGRRNVPRRQQLRSSVLEGRAVCRVWWWWWEWCGGEQNTKPRSHVSRGLPLSDVQRAVGGSHVTDPDQKNVYQSPNAQAPEAEQLSQPLSPLAQVEPVRPEAAKRDATWRHERRPSQIGAVGAHSAINIGVCWMFPASKLLYLSAKAVDHLYPPVQLQNKRFWKRLFPAEEKKNLCSKHFAHKWRTLKH